MFAWLNRPISVLVHVSLEAEGGWNAGCKHEYIHYYDVVIPLDPGLDPLVNLLDPRGAKPPSSIVG